MAPQLSWPLKYIRWKELWVETHRLFQHGSWKELVLEPQGKGRKRRKRGQMKKVQGLYFAAPHDNSKKLLSVSEKLRTGIE